MFLCDDFYSFCAKIIYKTKESYIVTEKKINDKDELGYEIYLETEKHSKENIIGNLKLNNSFIVEFENEHDIEANWLYKKAIDMPDDFSLDDYVRNKNKKGRLDFLNISSNYRICVKMYIYSLLVEEGHGESSVTGEFYKLKEFTDFLNKTQYIYDIKSITEKHVMQYLNELKHKIINTFVLKDGITIETGHKKFSTVRKFLLNMYREGVGELFFIEKIDVAELLPLGKPQFYYKGKELEKYYILKEKKHNDKTLEYSVLIEILDSMSKWNDEKLKCLVTILINTGLRVSEALNLDVDCFSELAQEEKEILEKNNIDLDFISSDKKGLYWLDKYLVSKTKKGDWDKGSPMLIGEKTKEAIETLSFLSLEAREKSKGKREETKIFASLNGKRVTVLSREAYAVRRNKICNDLNVPYFHFHQFRHTFAKILYDSGVPFPFIKKYLNHIYTDMTAHYINTSKNDKMKTYVEFVESEQISSPNEKAKELHNELKVAMNSEYFQLMAFDSRLQVLDLIMQNKELGLNVMDHGICLMPSGMACPNNFTEVDSCLDEMCGKFIATENTIPHIINLIDYRTKAINELEKFNFTEAARFNNKKLKQLSNTLNILKGNENE